MEGLKNMGLKRCFFLLSVFCLVTALLLTLGVYLLCGRIAERYPQGGIAIDSGGTVTELAGPDREQMQILDCWTASGCFRRYCFRQADWALPGFCFIIEAESPH